MVLRLSLPDKHEPHTMNSILHPAAALAAVALCTSALTAQTTVSIVADKDNTLYEDLTGTLSNAQGDLIIGRISGGVGATRRGLVHFDVASSVPAGAVVIEAELVMAVTHTIAGVVDTATFHRVLQDWGEGTSGTAPLPGAGGGIGYPSTTNDATWMHTFYPGTTWATPGGDFNPTASFGLQLLDPGAPFASIQVSTANAPGLISDVQDMLDNAATNFGWLIKLDETLPLYPRRLGSRESTVQVPTLNVTYLMPSDVGTVGLGCPVGAGTFELEFVGAAIGGTNVTIQRDNAVPASIGADFFSLYIDPVGVPLQPGCTVYLPLAQELLPGGAFLSGAGSSSAPFAVPAGFPGFLISCQSVVLDNSFFGLSLSNAAVMILQ